MKASADSMFPGKGRGLATVTPCSVIPWSSATSTFRAWTLAPAAADTRSRIARWTSGVSRECTSRIAHGDAKDQDDGQQAAREKEPLLHPFHDTGGTRREAAW